MWRRDKLRDATASTQSDISCLLEATPDCEFEERPRHTKGIKAKVALRKWIISWSLYHDIETGPHPYSAGPLKVLLNLRKHFAERFLAASEQHMRVARLRRARPPLGNAR
jgi:hypothetical protein